MMTLGHVNIPIYMLIMRWFVIYPLEPKFRIYYHLHCLLYVVCVSPALMYSSLKASLGISYHTLT